MKKAFSESDAARSSSGQFDTVSKRVIQQNPEDWIRFTLGIPEVLESRFQPSEVQALKPALENIKELQELKRLHHQALQVPNFEAFRSILGSNEN